MSSQAARERLQNTLRRLEPRRFVGTGGLAILCAVSALAVAPSGSADGAVAVAPWLGGLGLNVLAGVLQHRLQAMRQTRAPSEEARIERLAQDLAQDIEQHPELRREIGVFLESLDAFAVAEEIVRGDPAVHGWLLLKIYQDAAQYGAEFERVHASLDDIKRGLALWPGGPSGVRPFTLPPMPTLFVGRAEALRDLRARLGVGRRPDSPTARERLTIVRGWPGVGKTTTAAVLAYDPDVATVFPDGVLWVSLGPAPDVLSHLGTWGRALGTTELARARSLQEARALLASLLRNREMLLILDDVWGAQHALPFMVGGHKCATLVTTRLPKVADLLATRPDDIYTLGRLSDTQALELLNLLAPSVVADYPQETRTLILDLEGLPLALQVAGRLLNVEARLGFSITDLTREIREGARLLEAQPPHDRIEGDEETSLSVAALLRTSTDRLDANTRDCFAFLGTFAPKPATFNLEAMRAVWREDPVPIARKLAERGLLEPVPPDRFQMHALLVMHAKSFLTD